MNLVDRAVRHLLEGYKPLKPHQTPAGYQRAFIAPHLRITAPHADNHLLLLKLRPGGGGVDAVTQTKVFSNFAQRSDLRAALEYAILTEVLKAVPGATSSVCQIDGARSVSVLATFEDPDLSLYPTSLRDFADAVLRALFVEQRDGGAEALARELDRLEAWPTVGHGS